MEGLEMEWQNYLPLLQNKTVVSVYFGGGTPYLLGPQAIGKILAWIHNSVSVASEVEITLEANPENITLDTMRSYKEIGINRVSIGLQTLDNSLLQSLGRLHTGNKGIDSIYIAQSAGIENISIDLMYDLPKQTLDIWEQTVDQIRKLPITHLSLYNLTIEPHTVFFKYRETLQPTLPDEQTSLAMYEKAIHALSENGLMQYEISAFAKKDQYSRHNTGYWTGRPFLGYGPSAFSYWNGKRFRNVANLSKYVQSLRDGKSPIDFEEQLDNDAHKRELLVIGIRMVAGIDLDVFQDEHGKLDHEILMGMDKLIQTGFLHREGRNLSLTKKGVLFYDTVAAELI